MKFSLVDQLKSVFCGKKKQIILLLNLVVVTVFLSALINLVPSGIISPAASNLHSLNKNQIKNTYEVFGFAPSWTLNKLENVDFKVLTTLAYFSMGIDGQGNFIDTDPGYTSFYSDKATSLFQKAHDNGTRVVLTITQMNNNDIESLMDDPAAQDHLIGLLVNTVVKRGIDGVNVDFEYTGDPGPDYREKFSSFIGNLTSKMHSSLPVSKVTVSVYASAVKDPKIYDISAIANNSDGIFMMAYDFATAGSDNAGPTAPLYGYKEGKYWYDISTAVNDFLAQMPKDKLILGLPWYGYDFPVVEPSDKPQKDNGYYSYYWYRGYKYRYYVARPQAYAATYASAKDSVEAAQEGWDNYAQVGWKAYKENDGWRMVYLDDVRSLGIKYDFAKQKGLGGVGMWALGFDDGKGELWQLLEQKFGQKLVDNRIKMRKIYEI